MQRNLWAGLILLAMGSSAYADPQAKVKAVNQHENSYTYYNWKPTQRKVQTAPAVAPAATPAAAAAPSGYTPIRPTPALLYPVNGVPTDYSNPGYSAPPPPPPMNYSPQSYYSTPSLNSGFYSSGYAGPGLQVYNGFSGISISGIYRNGGLTVQAGNPGYYPGFSGGYGPGFNGGYGPGFSGGHGPGFDPGCRPGFSGRSPAFVPSGGVGGFRGGGFRR